MSYKFSFSDNEVYSSSDVNEITKRLVTSGIEDSFSDGVAYNVSRFNDAGKLLYTSGVVPETCLTLKVTKESDDKIFINPGLAFFNDGATIEIEAGGETLSYVSGAKNYVYLKNDLINTNRCFPCCTTQAPEGDYVLLAEIDASGNIEDKRTYAKGKLPGYQSVAGNVMIIDEKCRVDIQESGHYLKGSFTFDIGDNNYEYVLVINPFTGFSNMPCLGVYNILDKTYMSFYGYGSNYGGTAPKSYLFFADRIRARYDCSGDIEYDDFTIDVTDGILTVGYEHYREESYTATPGSYTYIPIKLILF